MVADRKMWDEAKINSIFPSHIANHILQTPLIDTVVTDTLLWSEDIHGCYSVKSGYRLFMHVTGSTGTTTQHIHWRKLRAIHTPPRAKNLLWRIVRGCLPTRVRLQDRRVRRPTTCSICNNNDEDEWHVLFGCNDSKVARQAAGLDHYIAPRLQQFNTVQQVLSDICYAETPEVAGKIAMLLWTIWSNRNKCVWNNMKDPGASIGARVIQFWSEWEAILQVQLAHSALVNQQAAISWQKPSASWLKCNVDAAFHANHNKTSTGWCLRDDEGRFVMAASAWMMGNYHIVEGEAIALLEALGELSYGSLRHH